jgi:hypothetical protein
MTDFDKAWSRLVGRKVEPAPEPEAPIAEKDAAEEAERRRYERDTRKLVEDGFRRARHGVRNPAKTISERDD